LLDVGVRFEAAPDFARVAVAFDAMQTQESACIAQTVNAEAHYYWHLSLSL
jgi:hypothetical protein